MISCHDGEFTHERMPLPMELGHNWCQPRQVSIEEVSPSVAPYKARFLGYNVSHVVLIPVVLEDDLKGILLLGTSTNASLGRDSMKRCVDLAGRFAVALASAEREEALYRQAHYDELTGLPNRQLLKDRLEVFLYVGPVPFEVGLSREEKRGGCFRLDLSALREALERFLMFEPDDFWQIFSYLKFIMVGGNMLQKPMTQTSLPNLIQLGQLPEKITTARQRSTNFPMARYTQVIKFQVKSVGTEFLLKQWCC